MGELIQKNIIKSDKAPKAIGPYSVAVTANHFVFTAGQIGIDPSTGNLVEGGIESETKQALENLKNILIDSGASIQSVLKTTVFLTDINDFHKINSIYGEYFSENSPARSAVQVAALPKGALIEIEAVAVIS
jgi:2-iminobutanoate/2-iminopropanoate deaminase